MTAAKKLYDLLVSRAAGLGRRLKEEEWLQITEGFLKTLGKERKAAAVADGAEEVYALYPKKVAKDEALKAISAALKKQPLEYLLDKTNQFALAVNSWPSSYRYASDGLDRCPFPATWFNQGRYQDDPREWRRAGARSGPDHRPYVPPAPITDEQRQADAEALKKILTAPEPAEGTLEHAVWLEARRGAVVASVVEASTAVPKAVEHDQRLRNA